MQDLGDIYPDILFSTEHMKVNLVRLFGSVYYCPI